MVMRALSLVVCALTSGCSMGFGTYEVLQCAQPSGTRTIQTVAALSGGADVGFSALGGGSVLACFIASVQGGACVQAITPSGYLKQGCAFLDGELAKVPRQPAVTALGPGDAAALVQSSAPCTNGMLSFRFAAPGGVVASDLACGAAGATTGAALPAIAALDEARALVAWYDTPLSSRADPIGSCRDAMPAPLEVASVSSGGAAAFSDVVQLTGDGVSLRPPAIVPLAEGVIVVAPSGDDVAVWQLDAALNVVANVHIPALAGARSVAAATIAVNGVDELAVAAEIGCAPQGIRLAVGDLAGGFRAVDVAEPNGAVATQPTVAWVDARGEWLVTWIASDGGAHALARRFGADGKAIHATIDPHLPATAAAASATGDIIAFSAADDTFVDASLGCDP